MLRRARARGDSAHRRARIRARCADETYPCIGGGAIPSATVDEREVRPVHRSAGIEDAPRNTREERRIESDRPSDRTQSGQGGGEVLDQPPRAQRRCRVRQIPRSRPYGRYRGGRVGTGRATSRPRPVRASHRRAFGSPVSSAGARPRRASTESGAPRPRIAMTRHGRTLELGVKGTETVPFATVTRYADSSWSPIGRLRIRLPVASWIALTSAGAYGGTPGSPTPHGRRCAKSSTMCTRTSSGASLMRVIG